MNVISRTSVFVGVALVSALLAAGFRYASRPAAVEGFSDVGQEFFAEFTDPLKAMELSVVKYDGDLKEPLSFSVKQNEKGVWVIPSHHNYPAEAAERLAKTAASLIGIRKVALQSRSKEDWGRYGVEDPATKITVADGEDGDSRGTRISLRDSSGNALVDLIVGKPVEGREKHYYVRQIDKNPVFVTRLDADLSAKFSDWIEPDLLKVNQNDLVRVVVDQYSVDEEQGAIIKGDRFEFAKDKTSGKWSMDGLNTDSEKLRESAVTDIARNLSQLRIVGIRPKPAGLNADLTLSDEASQNPLLQQVLQADMQRQGFYVARGPQNKLRLVSNEGELIAGTTNGVRYTLYFGEVARGTAKDIETGFTAENADPAGDSENSEDRSSPAGSGSETGPRRYLLVKVDFDESLLGEKPTEPVEPQKPAILDQPEAKSEVEAKPSADAPDTAEPTENAAPVEDPGAGESASGESESEESSSSPSDACDEPGADAATESENADSSDAENTPSQPGDDESKSEEQPAAAATDEEKKAVEADSPETADKPEATEKDPAAVKTSDEPAEDSPDRKSVPENTAPADEPADPRAEAQKQYDQAMSEYKAAKAGYESALRSWEGRAKDGQKRADELSGRFSGWYYVITGDSFEKFKVSREMIVEPASKSDGTEPGAGLPGGSVIPDFDDAGVQN